MMDELFKEIRVLARWMSGIRYMDVRRFGFTAMDCFAIFSR